MSVETNHKTRNLIYKELKDKGNEILIVEDEANVANLLSEHLRSMGFMVAVADTVNKAREGLYEMSPDLVFLDINLPDGLGLDLIPFLRRNHKCRIVAMSSDEQFMYDSMKGDSRADVFISKPFKMETIEKTLAYLNDLQE